MLNEKEQLFLGELYEKYYHKLLQYSFSILGRKLEHWDLAEDCVQQTFVKAMVRMDVLKNHPEPNLWLHKTCRYTTISAQKKLSRRSKILHKSVIPGEIYDTVNPKDDIADWIEKEHLKEELSQLRDELSDQELSVYRSLYENPATISDVTKYSSLSNGSVRGTKQRIKRKALKILSSVSTLFSVFLIIRGII